LAKFVYEEFLNAPSERRSFMLSRLNDFITESMITFANVYEEKDNIEKKIKGIEHMSNLLMSIKSEINIQTDLKIIPDRHAFDITEKVIMPLMSQYDKYSNYTIKNMHIK